MATFDEHNWKEAYKEGDDKNKVRIAGVEIETTVTNEDNPLHNCHDSDEFYSTPYLDYFKEAFGIDSSIMDTVGIDGSQLEFALEPDSLSYYRNGGSERFNKMFDFFEQDCEAKDADGTHVHISILESDSTNLLNNLDKLETCFGMQMQKIFGRTSTWALTRAQRIARDKFNIAAEQQLDPVLIPKKEYTSVYKDNKGSLIVNRHNQIEFRGGKGSTDREEVIAWVEFCDNIMNAANKKDLENLEFRDLLNGNYIYKYFMQIQEGKSPRRMFSDEEITHKLKDGNYIQLVLSNTRTVIL